MSENTSNLTAQVLCTAGLVEYQQGSVVSREMLKKGTGTVTVFAFDAGQGLSEHTAPFDALVHVLDGEAEITIAGTARDGECRQYYHHACQQTACSERRAAFQDDADYDPVIGVMMNVRV